jgi:excisionase family DNA binding protein
LRLFYSSGFDETTSTGDDAMANISNATAPFHPHDFSTLHALLDASRDVAPGRRGGALTDTIELLRLYSTDEVCELLDVSREALGRARKSGALRAVRPGRRVMFLGEALLAWLRGCGKGAEHA